VSKEHEQQQIVRYCGCRRGAPFHSHATPVHMCTARNQTSPEKECVFLCCILHPPIAQILISAMRFGSRLDRVWIWSIRCPTAPCLVQRTGFSYSRQSLSRPMMTRYQTSAPPIGSVENTLRREEPTTALDICVRANASVVERRDWDVEKRQE
jgi:hypothetical protein